MTLIQIDGALIQGYKDLSLGLPTSWEGEDFTPPINGDSWAEVTIEPLAIDVASLGVNGMDDHTGSMTIDFNVKPGDGRAELVGYCQAVRDGFTAGEWLNQAGQGVYIESVDRSIISSVGDWLRVSVTVNWLAQTIRPPI